MRNLVNGVWPLLYEGYFSLMEELSLTRGRILIFESNCIDVCFTFKGLHQYESLKNPSTFKTICHQRLLFGQYQKESIAMDYVGMGVIRRFIF